MNYLHSIVTKYSNYLFLWAVIFLFAFACIPTSYAASDPNVVLIQKIKWHHCKTNPEFLCGNLIVPLDYKRSLPEKVELPVSMHLATEKSSSYLLFNFGGPWADNVKILPSILRKRLTPTMIHHFNLLVISPRGVNPNTIVCKTVNQSKLDEINQSMKKIFAQGNQPNLDELYRLAEEKQKLCKYSRLSAYASTANTVQDMEMLRKTMGIEKLNIYMASYATRLGLAYLVKYPQHVQKIVLDGNIAPSNQLNSLLYARAFGAVTTFNAFFQNCYDAGNQCVLNKLILSKQLGNNPAALISQFKKLVKKAEVTKGIPTDPHYGNKTMTAEMIQNILYTEMQPSTWKELADALYQAEKNNNASLLMKIYTANTGYDPIKNQYGTGDMNSITRQAVICEDYILPDFNKKAVWLNFVNSIQKEYSPIGLMSTLWLTPICVQWKTQATPLLPDPSKNSLKFQSASPQVLIIGNATDPMTPFGDAIAVKTYLSKFSIEAKLLKWNGVSHTALITDSPLSSCIFHYVDQFLLNKHLPNSMHCDDWANPFLSRGG